MKDLLSYLIENIIKDNNFTVTEEVDGDRVNFNISLPSEKAGLVIGKQGRTIKAIRNLLKVRATLEKKLVFLTVS